jgi:uncharacterized ion transporter superfamily protein YfcC
MKIKLNLKIKPCVITPHTMIGNGKMNKIKMIFLRSVNGFSPPSLALGKDGLGEKVVVDAFVEGASSLVGVSLIIGLA